MVSMVNNPADQNQERLLERPLERDHNAAKMPAENLRNK
jgi:hypothetical protein